MTDKGKIKILIADDSLFMRKVLRQILSDDGYINIIECQDGNDCVETYEAEKPDLVLLDLIMPKMNGLEVLQHIGKTANVMIISAIGQEQMIQEAKLYGAKEYMQKPFLRDKILEKVHEMLSGLAVS